MIWIVHIILVSVLFVIAKYLKKDNIFNYGSFVYVIFVFGQRWMVGTDFPGYLNYYLIGYTKWREFLYFSIQETFSFFNIYFGLFLLVILLIIMFNFYRFLIKINKETAIMLFLFLFSEIFFAQLSQLRQFGAISFFIIAYYYMFQGDYFKVILNAILSIGFHFSALFVSILLLFKIKLNKVISLTLLSITAVLPFINIQFIFNLGIFSRYSGYLDSRFNVSLSSFHYVKFYSLLFIVFLYIILIDKIKDSKIEQMILNGIIMNLILYGFSFQFALLIRISSFFKIFEIVFLVYFFDRLKNISKTVILSAVIIYLVGVFGGLILTDPYGFHRYEFEPIRIIETRSDSFLRSEIDRFYNR